MWYLPRGKQHGGLAPRKNKTLPDTETNQNSKTSTLSEVETTTPAHHLLLRQHEMPCPHGHPGHRNIQYQTMSACHGNRPPTRQRKVVMDPVFPTNRRVVRGKRRPAKRRALGNNSQALRVGKGPQDFGQGPGPKSAVRKVGRRHPRTTGEHVRTSVLRRTGGIGGFAMLPPAKGPLHVPRVPNTAVTTTKALQAPDSIRQQRLVLLPPSRMGENTGVLP